MYVHVLVSEKVVDLITASGMYICELHMQLNFRVVLNFWFVVHTYMNYVYVYGI